MLELPIKDGSAHMSQNHFIAGESFRVTFDYSERENSWYFGLYTLKAEEIVVGRQIIPFKSMTKKYVLRELPQGSFWCFPKVKTDEPLSFNNLGFGKDYGVFFLTKEEEAAYGL